MSYTDLAEELEYEKVKSTFDNAHKALNENVENWCKNAAQWEPSDRLITTFRSKDNGNTIEVWVKDKGFYCRQMGYSASEWCYSYLMERDEILEEINRYRNKPNYIETLNEVEPTPPTCDGRNYKYELEEANRRINELILESSKKDSVISDLYDRLDFYVNTVIPALEEAANE